MKKSFVLLLGALLLFTYALGSGCVTAGKPQGGLSYDEYPTDYDPNVDSWKQIAPDDEDVEITWFTNYTYNDKCADLIYKRTGVKVKFQSAMTTDNSELNTMISGGRLPDVITIGDLGTRVQLAEEGYVYAIDRLAESYAPSMLKRISKEHQTYYAGSDGHMYGLASNFYNDADIAEYENDLGGHQFMNYDVIVRKDYLNAFIAYKTKQNPAFDADTYLTKPAGFIEMAKWVKSTYKLANSNPTVCLSPFNLTATNDCFNYSLSALMEFFCVPQEDADGNYVYQYDTPEFVEVMEFLNELYREKLITSGNFSYTRDNIGTQILNGKPFAFIGASQQHAAHLANREKDGYNAVTGEVDDAYEYVSIVLTNSRGDAPLLLDYAGRGLYVTMITANCKRPDRVIKVMDYYLSEQGQREMYYGENEGEYYTYKVKPGEVNPETGKVSTYGVMEWTEKAKEALRENNIQKVYDMGITRTTMLTNIMYTRMTSSDGYAINWLQTWIEFKNKCTYFDYSVSRVPFRYPLETDDMKALRDYTDMQADIEAVWIEAYPKMIMAESKEEMLNIYQKALSDSYKEGAEEWTAYRNRCFQAYKEELGIAYAWPQADPAYVAPAVTLFGGAERYMIPVPDHISWAN